MEYTVMAAAVREKKHLAENLCYHYNKIYNILKSLYWKNDIVMANQILFQRKFYMPRA